MGTREGLGWWAGYHTDDAGLRYGSGWHAVWYWRTLVGWYVFGRSGPRMSALSERRLGGLGGVWVGSGASGAF